MVTPLVFTPDEELDRYLVEDAPYGDLTTQLLGIGANPGCMTIRARHFMIVSSAEEAARMLQKAGCTLESVLSSGSAVNQGDVLIVATGSAAALHLGWKPVANLLEAACGIATRTRAIVDVARAENPQIEVVATRKIFPGTKRVATKAVLAGGGYPHRLGLSETVLVFSQHTVFLGGLEECLARVPEYRRALPEKKIEVEVTTRDEALRACRAGVDLVQVDKMSPEEFAELVLQVRAAGLEVKIAAAGGVNLDNAAAYAAAGADLLVTSAMYWGKPADISVTIEALL